MKPEWRNINEIQFETDRGSFLSAIKEVQDAKVSPHSTS